MHTSSRERARQRARAHSCVARGTSSKIPRIARGRAPFRTPAPSGAGSSTRTSGARPRGGGAARRRSEGSLGGRRRRRWPARPRRLCKNFCNFDSRETNARKVGLCCVCCCFTAPHRAAGRRRGKKTEETKSSTKTNVFLPRKPRARILLLGRARGARVQGGLRRGRPRRRRAVPSEAAAAAAT